jgi:lactoylglutathione lyase
VDVFLNLVVIRVSDMAASRRFYEALGLQFSLERHGNGPEHLAAELAGTVLEIYPRGNGPASSGVRLGFRVASVIVAVSAVEQIGGEIDFLPKEGPGGLRAVVVDPDGHRVALSQ